ncbi:unnamed protein product [Prunus armeniaca]|uniref:E3 ubiquitin protein ligase n=1 Tax=Prunus armeniaca TaxID=36596 RepID=A0A6J5WLT8_PRUAR|nr:unnamed protein product [Prunus armeniaca]
MENSDSDEQEKKRPHLNSLSPTMARSSTTSPPNNHSDLEAKIKEIKDKQDAIIQLPKIDDMMEREVKNLREAIDILHVKQKEYADVIRTYLSSQSTDQSEISRITGELDDSMTELEESRGKLVNLKMQKEVASGMHNLTSGAVNGTYHLKNQQKGQ